MRYFASSFLLALAVAACKTAAPVVQNPTPPTPVILSLGSKTFTTDDFFQSYTKNQLSADSAQRTDVKNYFDLYTNLKLKVLAAEAEGRDTTEAFREEMMTYRKQLAQPYLTDRVLIDALVAEAYQRMQEEVDISHILLAVPEDAAPTDTLFAYNKAFDLRKQLLSKQEFAAVAKAQSQDPVTATNGGNLGYVSAFGVIYPLETAAYTTPVGGISQPIRSRAGYHLVKVNERRPTRGRVRVAHILVRMSPSADEAGQQQAKQRIDAAYARLQKGDAFDVVCRDASDDLTTKSSGGILPIFEPGRWVPAFEDASFALQKPGDYSQPVRTNYGWHIIRLIERRGLEPFAAMAPSLRQRVTTDSRAELIRRATVQRLMNEYPVQTNEPVLTDALMQADSSLLRGQWRYADPLPANLQNKPLVTIAGKAYSVEQFFAYVRQRQQPPRKPSMASGSAPVQAVTGSPAVAMQRMYDRFVGDQLVATEEANLDKKSPEFRALMREIHDGVLSLQMMDENVIDRSIADSTAQKQFYARNKDKYRFPERAVTTILMAPHDSLLQLGLKALTGKPPYVLRRSAAPLAYPKNQTYLSPAQRESLFDALVVMASNPGYLIEVTGSHDPTERDSVSAGRIRSVVGYLRQNGVSLNRILERDYQGARPGVDRDAQRSVTFQYLTNAKDDVIKHLNSKHPQPSGAPAIVLTSGTFADGDSPYLSAMNQWETGTTVLHRDGKAIAVIIDRIEPARPKTFAEARGTIINEYQAELETQWLGKLRQTYPVKINAVEMQKMVK